MSFGLALSARLYESAVAPIIADAMPGLRYAAARLGDGSEVLGFDDAMSADHNYGPSLQIVLDEEDFTSQGQALMASLDARLPDEIGGRPTRFASFVRPTGRSGWLTSDHGIELLTLQSLLQAQLGLDVQPSTPLEWLALPEQRLLSVTAGAVLRDDTGQLRALRARLAWYPRDIWLARLAAQWSRIAEERALLGRTGDRGDEIGSRLLAARQVHDLMRLTFLVERRYAPYAKWFGSAFARLPSAPRLAPLLNAVLLATNWQDRESRAADAAHFVGLLQLNHEIPGAVLPRIQRYFNRPFRVINADQIADGLRAAIEDQWIRELATTGAVDQISDATPILTRPQLAHRLIHAIGDHSGRLA